MITLPKYLVVFAVLIVVQLNAQNFQGVATYKTKRQVDIKLDSTKVNSEMQKQIVEMMKKQFEKTYKLSFNKEESIYKEEEGLNKPQPSGGHFVMVTSGSDGSDMMYKNTKED